MVSSGRRAGGGGGDGEEARGAADLEDLGSALETAAATLDDDGFDFLPFALSPPTGASVDETASSTTFSGTRRSTGRGVSTSSTGMGEWCAGDEEGGWRRRALFGRRLRRGEVLGDVVGGHFDVAGGDIHR